MDFRVRLTGFNAWLNQVTPIPAQALILHLCPFLNYKMTRMAPALHGVILKFCVSSKLLHLVLLNKQLISDVVSDQFISLAVLWCDVQSSSS